MFGRNSFKLLALPVLALVVLVLAGGATGGLTPYAKGVPICKVNVNRYHATCFAMKRVWVKAGTAGAQPYVAPTVSGNATIGPNGGLTPSDIVSAYHLATSGGTGQTVAIVDAYNDPNIQSDLNTFDAQYGLSCSGCLTVANLGAVLPNNDQTGWSVEETLDVETVHSICPACHILLVEANSNSNVDLAAAENYAASHGATEISNSFGGTEQAGLESAYNHPGIVITASSGDDGYYNFDRLIPGGTNKPNTPAALSSVIAVGGTSLYLGQSTSTVTRASETVWNDNGPQDVYEQALGQPLGAGGGGCSTLYTATNWQKHVAGYTAAACSGTRLVSDISAVADPITGLDIYDSYTCASHCVGGPTWLTVGGTSLSAPLIAAAFGLAGGAHGISNPSLTLYSHPTSRYDVTVGGNGVCDGEGAAQCGDYNLIGYGILDCDYTGTGSLAAGTGACDAAAGFDGPTGMGTPNGMTLFARPVLTVGAIAGAGTIKHGVLGTWSAPVTDPAPGGIVTCVWNWGDGSSNTTGCSAHHTFSVAAKRTITLTTHDQYGITGTTMHKVVTVT